MSGFSSSNSAFQISGASLSFIASAVTASIIFRSPGGLQTPYRRIIFGISVSDTMQSFALLTGPFSVPKALQDFYPWASGNLVTCGFNGTFAVSGGLAVPLYTLLLCIYYLSKMKYSMTNSEFSQRIEYKAHVLIIMIAASASIAALFSTSINPIPGGALCHIATYPPGCQIFPMYVGECTRGLQAKFLVYIFVIGLQLFALPGIAGCMMMLAAHAIAKGRIFTASLLESGGRNLASNQERNFKAQQPNETRSNYLARIYRRETLIQASLYVTAFFGVYFLSFFLAIANVFKMKNLKAQDFLIAISIVYPIGGVFNILIFSRAKVAVLRRDHSRFCWAQGQWIVLKHGGEVPSAEILMEIEDWFQHFRRKEKDVLQHSTSLENYIPCSNRSFRSADEEPNSLAVANGVSQSFHKDDEGVCDAIAYRSRCDWNHIKGSDATLIARKSFMESEENTHEVKFPIPTPTYENIDKPSSDVILGPNADDLVHTQEFSTRTPIED